MPLQNCSAASCDVPASGVLGNTLCCLSKEPALDVGQGKYVRLLGDGEQIFCGNTNNEN